MTVKGKTRFITTLKKVDSVLESEYGFITYGEWCKEEAIRIGGEAKVVTEKHSGIEFCCVARW